MKSINVIYALINSKLQLPGAYHYGALDFNKYDDDINDYILKLFEDCFVNPNFVFVYVQDEKCFQCVFGYKNEFLMPPHYSTADIIAAILLYESSEYSSIEVMNIIDKWNNNNNDLPI